MTRGRADGSAGQAAPPLRLPRSDGQDELSLESLRGRPVLVTFLSHAA